MFTIDTVVDQSVKTVKQGLSYVQDKSVKAEFEALVDAQAAYTKTVYNTGLELAKLATVGFGKFDANSFDFSKLFTASK